MKYIIIHFLLSISSVSVIYGAIDVEKAKFIQRVKLFNAMLIDGRTPHGQQIVEPRLYSFYAAESLPRIIQEDTKTTFTRSVSLQKEKEKEKKGKEKENYILAPALDYYIVFSEDMSPLCLVSAMGGDTYWVTKIIKSGEGIYQNDQKNMDRLVIKGLILWKEPPSTQRK